MFQKAQSVLKVSTTLAVATLALLLFQGCGGGGGSGTASNPRFDATAYIRRI